MLRNGDGVPVMLNENEGDAEEECDADTEPEGLLVKACVVPMAVVEGLASHVRVAPEALIAGEALGNKLGELETLPEGDTLGDAVIVADRHCVAEPEGEDDAVLARLGERSPDSVTDTEEVGDGAVLDDSVTEGLRDTLTVRERLRVGQLDAVEEEERHSVAV